MNIKPKQFVEAVGVFGIIASLLFVGMQLLLDRRVALSEQYASRAESIKSDMRARLESDAFMSMIGSDWDQGIRPSYWNEDLEKYIENRNYTGTQAWARLIAARFGYFQYDNLYYQYNNGLLEPDYWNEARLGLKNELRNPLTRAVFLNMGFDRPIVSVIEDLIREVDDET